LPAALPHSHQVTPNIPTGDEQHNKSKSGHPGRQPQSQSARRPLGTISTSSDITDTPSPNSKPQRGSADCSVLLVLIGVFGGIAARLRC
jgi:hypothetical protein